jgi:hypothetical protein
MATEDSARIGRLRLFFILFSSFLALTSVEAVSLRYGLDRYWRGVLREEITRNLTEKARMFAARVNGDRAHKISELTSEEGLDAGARATVVDENRRVIADSEVPLSSLENEGRRPEFLAALRGETGIETRRRGPFGLPVVYVAVPISGGAVRLAYPLADIGISSAGGRHVLLVGTLLSMLATLVVSAAASEMIHRHLGKTAV